MSRNKPAISNENKEFMNLVNDLFGLVDFSYNMDTDEEDDEKPIRNLATYLSTFFDQMIDASKNFTHPFAIKTDDETVGKRNYEALRKYSGLQRPFNPEDIAKILVASDFDGFERELERAINNLKEKDDIGYDYLIQRLRQHYPNLNAELNNGNLLWSFIRKKVEMLLNIIAGNETADTGVYRIHDAILYPRTITDATARRFKSRLISSFHDCCPVIGCCNKLTYISEDEELRPNYGIVRLDPDNGEDYKNLVPLCSEHYSQYIAITDEDNIYENAESVFRNLDIMKDLSMHQEEYDNLIPEHQILGRIDELLQNLDDLSKPERIAAIERVHSNDDENVLLKYDPARVDEKIINATDNIAYEDLADMVKNHVAKYFPFITERLSSLDNQNILNEQELRRDIRAFYEALRDRSEYKIIDYTEVNRVMVDWIHRTTNYDPSLCQIVISSFIQSCEIFDRNTEA